MATMDFCGHLLKQCYETQEFTLPKPVSMIDNAKTAGLNFTSEENEVNLLRCQKKQFYDQNVCRHLCSKTLVLESTRTNPLSPCESMCFELTRSSKGTGEVCPFQKHCINGCPCRFYECEKFESRQKLVPVFNLHKNSTGFSVSDEVFDSVFKENTWHSGIRFVTGSHRDPKHLHGRLANRDRIQKETFPIIFSDFGDISKRIDISHSFFPYERFPEFVLKKLQ